MSTTSLSTSSLGSTFLSSSSATMTTMTNTTTAITTPTGPDITGEACPTAGPSAGICNSFGTGTQLPANATSIPNAPSSCGNIVYEAPVANAINVFSPVGNGTLAAMETCCDGYPVYAWQGGCSVYCAVGNASEATDLGNCLSNLSQHGVFDSVFVGPSTSGVEGGVGPELKGMMLTALMLSGLIAVL